jgi:hypothetical protein
MGSRGGRLAGGLVGGLVALLLTTGCARSADGGGGVGGLDEDSDEGRAVEILAAANFQDSEDVNAVQYTRDEAHCAAQGVVGSLGVSRLQELGLELDAGTKPTLEEPPLTTAEADAVYAAITGCVDVAGQITDMLVRGRLSEDDALCVAQGFVDSGVLRHTLLADTEHQPPAEEVDDALSSAGEACGVTGVGLLPPD